MKEEEYMWGNLFVDKDGNMFRLSMEDYLEYLKKQCTSAPILWDDSTNQESNPD